MWGPVRFVLNAPTPRQSLAEPDDWPGSAARIGKLGLRPRTVPIRHFVDATCAKMECPKNFVTFAQETFFSS